ncbi:hypothetical protein B277_15479 [Janibacter hoylei PVAS-1]|uniref:Uncharacterized protein n=1 Tax=Janibacter hoylei PVAS-1 TaxID=1210046 RepID=K1DTW5_9MICO|nr:hypothetical protein B277_15479 [Janibacter hoylei PVAS-1]
MGCALSVSIIATGSDGHAGDQGHARDTGASAVEARVGRARALGVETEEVALTEHGQPGTQRGLARLAAAAVDGQLADAPEEGRGEPPFEAGAGEVVRLREEGQPPVDDERQEDRVGEGQVVAGQDRRPLGGNVLEPLDLGSEEDPEQRPEEDPLEHPVQHCRTTS